VFVKEGLEVLESQELVVLGDLLLLSLDLAVE
jgi:hypothetical protein